MSYFTRSQGAALAPLSNEQKQKLAAIAHYAYAEVGPDETFDDWRHAEVRRAVGKGGLRECVNEDYNPLKSRWLYMCGYAKSAFTSALKGENEPRSIALFCLRREATEAKDVMPEAMKYARGMIHNISGATLEDAPENLIWRAVYAVRRKAQSLRRQKKGGETSSDVLTRILGAAPKPAKRRMATTKGPF